ncbi:ubiquinol-cytochrome C chaperone family protein [Lichenibacterium dinghuense]|uniref:ubiquinol-cytochrome C chaperone family protein n=1 Tax=Lichenibacterium dinghuense TaxID=2895977 RepID=UPI001F467E22|nr:ubiquinol-cytochrome C chaperone family protein [Lichenibacterium sp. 6Y81]
MVIPFGMLLPFGRRRPSRNRVTLDRLHGEIVGAVRRPAFYLDYGVPDTFEGRFELLALHAGLVLRRFNAAEAPGPAVAQDLVDTVFAHLEADLREAGVGDITVPKRMKKLCEAFLGRSAAYDAGLRAGAEALAAAVGRNVYAGRGGTEAAARMARYAAAAAEALAATPLDGCLAGPLPFPDPSAVPVPSPP